MADNRSARDNSEGRAPLLPGGEPELSGTGPQGAEFAQDGSVVPGVDDDSGVPNENDGAVDKS